MLFAELIPLTAGLRERGRHITIETAGTLYLPVACDLMSISPKLANSTPAAAQRAALEPSGTSAPGTPRRSSAGWSPSIPTRSSSSSTRRPIATRWKRTCASFPRSTARGRC